ncbi:Uncharacterised protein [Mycobacteroides abscessus subsp. abscessus]|uniref:hypothetical protein n=1 Tax=Mycobacteroides abscessus TaxID=36809 RepID=UPI0009262D73|nr:hypothetical protein [Mycobacteroides abscessus]SHU67264.1 Uncharacterised protein [Mycobacteroides abscessus subsp. abscessus]
MIHVPSPLTPVSCNAPASTGTRWWTIRSTVDWLVVVNRAAKARVVRLVGAQVNQHQQQPYRQWQAPRPPTGRRDDRVGNEREDAAELVIG